MTLYFLKNKPKLGPNGYISVITESDLLTLLDNADDIRSCLTKADAIKLNEVVQTRKLFPWLYAPWQEPEIFEHNDCAVYVENNKMYYVCFLENAELPEW